MLRIWENLCFRVRSIGNFGRSPRWPMKFERLIWDVKSHRVKRLDSFTLKINKRNWTVLYDACAGRTLISQLFTTYYWENYLVSCAVHWGKFWCHCVWILYTPGFCVICIFYHVAFTSWQLYWEPNFTPHVSEYIQPGAFWHLRRGIWNLAPSKVPDCMEALYKPSNYSRSWCHFCMFPSVFVDWTAPLMTAPNRTSREIYESHWVRPRCA